MAQVPHGDNLDFCVLFSNALKHVNLSSHKYNDCYSVLFFNKYI